MCTIENEIQVTSYEKNNQKVLTNGGVQLYFSNVFDQTDDNKLPMIKLKLRRILVDFGLVQTCIEIDQKLDFIKVLYKDEQAKELRGLLLQRFNRNRKNQAIELNVSLERNLVIPPSKMLGIKTYTGLTNLLYKEFILASTSSSMIDDNPFNEIKTIIQKGNLAPTVPLESIFRGELD